MAKIITLPTHFVAAGKGIIQNNQLLAAAIGVPVAMYDKRKQQANGAVLAWGRRPSANKAAQLAHALNAPLWTAEDGFLRSLDSGTGSRFGASFVLDRTGIYFDNTRENDLQKWIDYRVQHWTADDEAYATRLIAQLLDNELSKYNAIAATLTVPDNMLLVVDQVAGDASIAGAAAAASDFYQMLLTACQYAKREHLTVCIKAHPAGKSGFLIDETGQLNPQARTFLQTHLDVVIGDFCIINTSVNPIALVKKAVRVFSVSSHLGFEALMAGKAVHCFGVSWYAGFGLTCDEALHQNHAQNTLLQAVKSRRLMPTASVAQLFFAAYIDYSHYANPATKQPCDIDTVIDYLLTNRHWQARLGNDLLAYEFSRWKKGFVRGFLGFPQTNLQFKMKTKMRLLFSDRLNERRAVRDDKLALEPLKNKPNQRYAVWGLAARRKLQQKLQKLGAQNPHIFCMEDGFIRSNGLGATLLAPLSVVMDGKGVYYDATAACDLEEILVNITLDDAQNTRAERLKLTLLANKVSKYNVGASSAALASKLDALKMSKNRTVHLVVGQVEDDASVQNCASVIVTNGELLRQVRAKHPDDIIIYKPHPDIEAGLRTGAVDAQTLQLADVIARDIAMPECLDLCQVVHTISSLTGFEALLRGVSVVCYGLPFYAGFGLTCDVVEQDNAAKIAALSRRQRTTPLTLNELIYATLIAYPLYHLPHGHGLAQVEDVIDYLYHQTHTPPKKSALVRVRQAAKTRFMQLRRHYLDKLNKKIHNK